MLVDHAERRVRLAEAVWRVIARAGVAGASVRGVAREAQLSMGSVRHFFATQDELLQFAMREVIVRATKRVADVGADQAAIAGTGQPLEPIAQRLEQILPLDQDRLTEAQIWLAFSTYGAQHPAMAAIRQEADDAVRLLCRNCLAELGELGLLAETRDLEVETEALWALLDGLTIHIVLASGTASAALAATVLRAHLAALATGPTTSGR